MSQWILTLDTLDANDTAETLYFTSGSYVDNDQNYYDSRIITPALVTVSPNDGGLLGIFDSASVGDIELENKDGGLDYLASYAIDGRAAVLSWVDENETVTEYYRGVVTKMAESGGRITLSLKAPHEVLTDNFPMSIYAGTNSGFLGLEGTADDIKDSVKTQVFGDCRNIAATLVNSSLLIYQVSSRDDCIVTAVYDDGVKLVNYQTSTAHSIGDATIGMKNGIGALQPDLQLKFANHSALYSVETVWGDSIVLSSGLSVAVPKNTAIEIIDFYADLTDLQAADYQVSGAHAANIKAINLYNGVGDIAAGELLMFSNQTAIYTVATALSGGVITLSAGLIIALNGDEFVYVIGTSPALWGGYQGYFRLTTAPVGTITCDAVSINNGAVRKAGDVFNDIGVAAGLTIDSSSVTELNNAGTLGLYVDSQTTISDLLDKIIRSVGGFYHILNGVLYANLLFTPKLTADFVIEDWQIDRIERVATGLGSNGLPIKAFHALYDRIETVQTTLAGGVSEAWRERLRKQYREITTTEAATATRHPMALTLEVESLLRSLLYINALKTRLFNVTKVRRDIVTIDVIFTELPAFLLADTVKIITPRLGYSAGRNFVIIGYTIDMKSKIITLKAFG